MDSDGSQIICIILLIFFSTGKIFLHGMRVCRY